MILIYTAVVGVVVGVVSPETLLHGNPGGGPSLTPMADGANALFGGGAVWYWLYGRRRTDRVGALYLILRRHRGRSAASDQEHLLPGRKRE